MGEGSSCYLYYYSVQIILFNLLLFKAGNSFWSLFCCEHIQNQRVWSDLGHDLVNMNAKHKCSHYLTVITNLHMHFLPNLYGRRKQTYEEPPPFVNTSTTYSNHPNALNKTQPPWPEHVTVAWYSHLPWLKRRKQ